MYYPYFTLGSASITWAVEPYDELQTEWAKGKYELSGSAQEKFLEQLLSRADAPSRRTPTVQRCTPGAALCIQPTLR